MDFKTSIGAEKQRAQTDGDARPEAVRQTITGDQVADPKGGQERSAGRPAAALRWLKHFFGNEPSKTRTLSWYEELRSNPITFVASFAALGAALICLVILPPDITPPPFAVLACSLLALVVSGRWGTIAAMVYSLMVLVIKIRFHVPPFELGTLLWNLVMRFIFLEIYVVLFDYVRRRSASGAQK